MYQQQTFQLTSDWRIPSYAQSMIWAKNAVDAAPTTGEEGTVTLGIDKSPITLHWGNAQGPAFTQLKWQPDDLHWDGSIRIGGMVDAVHLSAFAGLDETIAVVHIGGQPLLPDTAPFARADQRQNMPYAEPEWLEGIDNEVDFGYTTWLVGEESPLYAIVYDALSSKLPIHAYGLLPSVTQGWHQHVALPILLQAITVFTS